jgi:aminoglycoside 6'-N-acetyltransferase
VAAAGVSAVRPTLREGSLVVRPGRPGEEHLLAATLAEPSVAAWWGAPMAPAEVGRCLWETAPPEEVLLVVEAGGAVAGGIQYWEEADPMYRHAGIDVFLGAAAQGRGAGTGAVRLLAGWLFAGRGHHRVVIDPAASNDRAIRAYERVGFRRVGVMRRYERGPDGTFHDGLLMDLLPGDLTGPPPPGAAARTG